MSNKEKLEILREMKEYFPDAKIELNYSTHFQLLIAIMLSAQTTDKKVNQVTEELFAKYPTAKQLKVADADNVQKIIKQLGLSQSKTKNIIATAKIYDEQYLNKMPKELEKLMSLPGVGQKTASATLANIYNLPYMAVDTHINRVCQRLKIVKVGSTPEATQKKLQTILKDENINEYHHTILFFGRYHCLARNPKCKDCHFKNCRYLA